MGGKYTTKSYNGKQTQPQVPKEEGSFEIEGGLISHVPLEDVDGEEVDGSHVEGQLPVLHTHVDPIVVVVAFKLKLSNVLWRVFKMPALETHILRQVQPRPCVQNPPQIWQTHDHDLVVAVPKKLCAVGCSVLACCWERSKIDRT